MPITVTHRANLASTANNTNTPYTATPAWTPAANSLLLAFISKTGDTTDPAAGAVTGHGVTYTQIAVTTVGSGTVARLYLYAALAGASPTSTPVSVTWTTAQTGCLIHEAEVTGYDNSLALGPGAGTIIPQAPVVNGAGVSAASGSVSLSAAVNPDNRAVSVWTHAANAIETTPRTNWTELDDQSYNTPVRASEYQWRSDAFETTASATWTTSSSWAGIAAEIAAPIQLEVLIAAEVNYTAAPRITAFLEDFDEEPYDFYAQKLDGTVEALIGGPPLDETNFAQSYTELHAASWFEADYPADDGADAYGYAQTAVPFDGFLAPHETDQFETFEALTPTNFLSAANTGFAATVGIAPGQNHRLATNEFAVGNIAGRFDNSDPAGGAMMGGFDNVGIHNRWFVRATVTLTGLDGHRFIIVTSGGVVFSRSLAGFGVDANDHPAFFDNSLALVSSMALVLPEEKPFRIEVLWARKGPTSGANLHMEASIFLDPTASVADEFLAVDMAGGGVQFSDENGVAIGYYGLGDAAVGNHPGVFVDDFGLSTRAFPAPTGNTTDGKAAPSRPTNAFWFEQDTTWQADVDDEHYNFYAQRLDGSVEAFIAGPPVGGGGPSDAELAAADPNYSGAPRIGATLDDVDDEPYDYYTGTVEIVAAFSRAIATGRFASLVLSDNPLAYWRLGESAGPTAFDSSGHSYDGTYQGSPAGFSTPGLAAPDADTALNADGVDDAIVVVDAPDDPLRFDGTEPWTLFSIIKVPAGETSIPAQITTELGGGGEVNFMLGSHDGSSDTLKPSVGFYNGSWSVAIAPTNASLDVAHVVMGTWDGSALRIYVDGLLAATNSSPTGTPRSPTADRNIRLLNRWDASTVQRKFFLGVADELVIFPTALDAKAYTYYSVAFEIPERIAQMSVLEPTADLEHDDHDYWSQDHAPSLDVSAFVAGPPVASDAYIAALDLPDHTDQPDEDDAWDYYDPFIDGAEAILGFLTVEDEIANAAQLDAAAGQDDDAWWTLTDPTDIAPFVEQAEAVVGFLTVEDEVAEAAQLDRSVGQDDDQAWLAGDPTDVAPFVDGAEAILGFLTIEDEIAEAAQLPRDIGWFSEDFEQANDPTDITPFLDEQEEYIAGPPLFADDGYIATVDVFDHSDEPAPDDAFDFYATTQEGTEWLIGFLAPDVEIAIGAQPSRGEDTGLDNPDWDYTDDQPYVEQTEAVIGFLAPDAEIAEAAQLDRSVGQDDDQAWIVTDPTDVWPFTDQAEWFTAGSPITDDFIASAASHVESVAVDFPERIDDTEEQSVETVQIQPEENVAGSTPADDPLYLSQLAPDLGWSPDDYPDFDPSIDAAAVTDLDAAAILWPVTPYQQAIDTFTRADSTNLGTTEQGGFAWLEVFLDWQIVSGQLAPVGNDTTNGELAAIDLRYSDHSVSIDQVDPTAQQHVVARATDFGNLLLAGFQSSSSTLSLFKRINLTFTLVGSVVLGSHGPHRVQLWVEGDLVTVIVDGITQLAYTITDPELRNGTLVGAYSGVNTSKFDNLDASPPSWIVAAAQLPPRDDEAGLYDWEGFDYTQLDAASSLDVSAYTAGPPVAGDDSIATAALVPDASDQPAPDDAWDGWAYPVEASEWFIGFLAPDAEIADAAQDHTAGQDDDQLWTLNDPTDAAPFIDGIEYLTGFLVPADEIAQAAQPHYGDWQDWREAEQTEDYANDSLDVSPLVTPPDDAYIVQTTLSEQPWVPDAEPDTELQNESALDITATIPAASLPAADTFGRADNDQLGLTEVGNWPWIEAQDFTHSPVDLDIATGKLSANSTATRGIALLDLGILDVDLAADCDTSAGIYFRYADRDNYLALGHDDNTTLTLYKFVGGTPTAVGTYAEVLASARLRVVVIGDNVFVYQNGVQRITYTITDPILRISTRHGIGATAFVPPGAADNFNADAPPTTAALAASTQVFEQDVTGNFPDPDSTNDQPLVDGAVEAVGAPNDAFDTTIATQPDPSMGQDTDLLNPPDLSQLDTGYVEQAEGYVAGPPAFAPDAEAIASQPAETGIDVEGRWPEWDGTDATPFLDGAEWFIGFTVPDVEITIAAQPSRAEDTALDNPDRIEWTEETDPATTLDVSPLVRADDPIEVTLATQLDASVGQDDDQWWTLLDPTDVTPFVDEQEEAIAGSTPADDPLYAAQAWPDVSTTEYAPEETQDYANDSALDLSPLTFPPDAFDLTIATQLDPSAGQDDDQGWIAADPTDIWPFTDQLEAFEEIVTPDEGIAATQDYSDRQSDPEPEWAPESLADGAVEVLASLSDQATLAAAGALSEPAAEPEDEAWPIYLALPDQSGEFAATQLDIALVAALDVPAALVDEPEAWHPEVALADGAEQLAVTAEIAVTVAAQPTFEAYDWTTFEEPVADLSTIERRPIVARPTAQPEIVGMVALADPGVDLVALKDPEVGFPQGGGFSSGFSSGFQRGGGSGELDALAESEGYAMGPYGAPAPDHVSALEGEVEHIDALSDPEVDVT